MFQSTWRSSSSLLTKPLSCCATAPWAVGGLFSASLHKTVRCICRLGVGTYHGSCGTVLRIANTARILRTAESTLLERGIYHCCRWWGNPHSAVAVGGRQSGRLFPFAATWWRWLGCCWLITALSHCWHSDCGPVAAPAVNVLACVHKHHTHVYRSVIFAVTAIL